MYTLISYAAGIVLEGVIVNRTEDRMRMVAAGLPDTLGITRVGERWVTDEGEAIEFEFLASSSPVEEPAAPRLAIARAAGASQN